MVMPELPAATDGTEALTEPVLLQPENPDKGQGILAYWPVAVAAIIFFGGSATAVWALLIRPAKRAKHAARRGAGKGARSRRR